VLGILGIGQAAQNKRPFIRNSCMVAKSAYALFSHSFINSYIMSVHPFVYIYQCGSHWVDFCEICQENPKTVKYSKNIRDFKRRFQHVLLLSMTSSSSFFLFIGISSLQFNQ
jgi:hypothetical protein